jgi:hypothetical protein
VFRFIFTDIVHISYLSISVNKSKTTEKLAKRANSGVGLIDFMGCPFPRSPYISSSDLTGAAYSL